MAEDTKATEAAIADVLQTRLMAWNAGDLEGYSQLLTEDADVVSATGRKSAGQLCYETVGAARCKFFGAIDRAKRASIHTLPFEN